MIIPSIKFGNEGVCTYCGDVATAVDHCIPISFQTLENRLGKMRKYGPQTPSCHHCNSKLSSKHFDTFYDRCKFVSDSWSDELKPVLWTQKEIEGLSGWLRNRVASEMNRRMWLFNRADWMDTRDFWLNIENLTWDERLSVGSKTFHPALYEYFKSTVALASLAYSETWTRKKS